MTARLALLLPLAIAACAPSPLYVGAAGAAGTTGEVPRDGQGEPVWGAIRAAPVIAPPPPGLAVNPGVPITQVPGAAPD